MPYAISIEETLLWPFGVTRNSNKHSRLHVNFPIFFPDLNHIWNFATDFRIKVPKIKFHGNRSSKSGGQTERQM